MRLDLNGFQSFQPSVRRRFNWNPIKFMSLQSGFGFGFEPSTGWSRPVPDYILIVLFLFYVNWIGLILV